MDQKLTSFKWRPIRLSEPLSISCIAITLIPASLLTPILTKTKLHDMKTKKKIVIGVSALFFFIVAISLLPTSRKTIKTEHFTFVFSDKTDSQKVIEISKHIESNYLRIARNLRTSPSKNIEINIHANRWNYIKATKDFGASGIIVGPSKIHYIEKSLSESKQIAVHEFTHTVVLNLLINRESQPFNSKMFDQRFSSFPVWLWEAISVYESEQFIDPNHLEDLRKGKYPSIDELDTRYKGQKSYAYGYTLIEFILSKYGVEKLIELIENYGNLNKTLDITKEQFSKDWYVFVQKKYLK